MRKEEEEEEEDVGGVASSPACLPPPTSRLALWGVFGVAEGAGGGASPKIIGGAPRDTQRIRNVIPRKERNRRRRQTTLTQAASLETYHHHLHRAGSFT
ncbi:hypothetical protein Pcinc_036156 [Petrolisthes cinctipes]|uniref:Uncharacterized protein n=1 Tax=Petrolisthes cinctipes TaxID=88211 RepID=A0AAE1BY97_PETCI|nr:hypothetical protein Pcinc_036156 [Petrolisthes cinctipes]